MGLQRNPPKLSPIEASLIGEDYMRKVWWWFFKNGFIDDKDGLQKGTKKINDHILKQLSHEESC